MTLKKKNYCMTSSPHNPLVSIVIPTHNRADLLERAVRSVLRQTYQHLEIVIVDDGSEDGTPERVEFLQEEHSNIVYLRNPRPLGACITRNSGIEAAKGFYVGLLDDDDEFTPNWVEDLVNCFKKNPDWSFVGSDYLSVRRNGTRHSHKPGPISLRKILWMSYASVSILVEREKILAIGGFDKNLTAAQDYDMVTRLIERFGPAYRLGKVGFIYHQEHEKPRITSTLNKRMRGYYDYYLKFKHLMTRAQRAYHLYRFQKIKGYRITWKRFFGMVPLRYYPLELNDYLIIHTNFYQWLNRIMGIWKRQETQPAEK
jgi:glycosyltransferase involved in cell wall biosynthesis